jgi:hypothetical protein
MNAKTPIESMILELRGTKVIMAGDLASLYGVETRALNQQVRRNAERIPNDFCFQLSAEEWETLVSRRMEGRTAGQF